MRRTKARNPQSISDSYLSLIQRFPLKPINNDREHARASEMVSELIGRNLDSGSADYLDTLLVLVNKYEDESHAIDERMTPQEAVRSLMEFNGLSQADIGRIIGSESAVSMFLRGDRGLSKSQIKKLAERFKIDAAVFM
jgi:HTH-type transcriptional regulator / antitoxin HigA